jgi:hypothetical protein
VASDHIDELASAAPKAIRPRPRSTPPGQLDWLHVNSATQSTEPVVRSGDRRRAEHVISAAAKPACSRLSAATGRSSGGGPGLHRIEGTPRDSQIIGQHHAHLIPVRLPGAGNLLVFDNGGASGYGFANPIALMVEVPSCTHVARAEINR